MISHSSKVFLHIIKRRVTPPIERRLSQTQLGFLKGKGTRDGLSLVRILLERTIQKQQDLFICFIDYQKAFDRINHDKLVAIMLEVGIPLHEVKLIVDLYWKQTACVKLDEGCTRKLRIQPGARQGCILSPILFNL